MSVRSLAVLLGVAGLASSAAAAKKGVSLNDLVPTKPVARPKPAPKKAPA